MNTAKDKLKEIIIGVNEGKWIIERYKNYTVHLIKIQKNT
jgi:hypothetical protein